MPFGAQLSAAPVFAEAGNAGSVVAGGNILSPAAFADTAAFAHSHGALIFPKVSWTAGEGAITYRMYAGRNSGTYEEGFQDCGLVLTINVSWLAAGDHYIVVRAWDGTALPDGESDVSNELLITI